MTKMVCDNVEGRSVAANINSTNNNGTNTRRKLQPGRRATYSTRDSNINGIKGAYVPPHMRGNAIAENDRNVQRKRTNIKPVVKLQKSSPFEQKKTFGNNFDRSASNFGRQTPRNHGQGFQKPNFAKKFTNNNVRFNAKQLSSSSDDNTSPTVDRRLNYKAKEFKPYAPKSSFQAWTKKEQAKKEKKEEKVIIKPHCELYLTNLPPQMHSVAGLAGNRSDTTHTEILHL
jgi:hypothetical protein